MTDDEKAQAIAELLNIDYEQIKLECEEQDKDVVKYFIIDGMGAELKLDGDLLLQLECGIEFYDCKFPEFIKIEVKTYKYHLGFDKCTFLGFVECKRSVFSDEVKFVGCTFKEGVNFCAGFQGRLDFSHSIFEKNVYFRFEPKDNVFKKEEAKSALRKHVLEVLSSVPPEFLNVNELENLVESALIFQEVSFKACKFFGQVVFSECRFLKLVNFSKTFFTKSMCFKDCIFDKNINMEELVYSPQSFMPVGMKSGGDGETKMKLEILDCAFGGEVKLCNSKLLGEADFSGSSFAKKANFSQTIFGNEKDSNDIVSFKHCVFSQGADFSNARVHASIYFNHAKFSGEVADFHESQFDKVACFYGVMIGGKAPNFSQAIFNGNLNFVNTKIMLDFEGLRDFVVDKADRDERLSQEKREVGWREKTANDYRDSFRLIKNNLLKNNNTLDASQYHKMELYCKEIELESKRQKSLSDWLERWQLWFYRNTSDHHTDLLRIIACVVACIGLFGYVLLGIFASDEKIAEFVAKLNSAFIALVYCIFLHSSCYLFYGERWRKIVIYLCWILPVFFGVLILSLYPNYIIDLLKGSLIDECLFFAQWQNIILLVHVILLGLLLFSLQKTARKNSIIPS